MKSYLMLLPGIAAGGKTGSILVRHGPLTHALTSPFAGVDTVGGKKLNQMKRIDFLALSSGAAVILYAR